jgi:phospholipase/lecithinase/hemolysin
MLDDPNVVGDGGVWLDHVHPTSNAHDVVARDLAAFLDTIQSENYRDKDPDPSQQ